MSLRKLSFTNFTAFRSLEVPLGPGLNVFVGANGTGKTHLLKVGYAACAVSETEEPFAAKLQRVFLPYGGRLGRLVHRQQGSSKAALRVDGSSGASLSLRFSNHTDDPRRATESGQETWSRQRIRAAYVPVKEMLANAPGFRSLYATRQVAFEEVYADIIDRAFLPVLRGPTASSRRALLTSLQRAMSGKVVQKNETFFLKNPQGELEFPLLAEGHRKLGLLWLLIQNGTLLEGSVLFWDEPETNLNPGIMGTVIDVLAKLARSGVQILLATHDYSLLKEIELASREEDDVRYHALYRDGDGIAIETAPRAFELANSAISLAMSRLYDREIQRAVGVRERTK